MAQPERSSASPGGSSGIGLPTLARSGPPVSGLGSVPPPRPGDEDLEPPPLRNVVPWLTSALVHMALFIILGLTVIVIQQQQRIELQAEATPIYAEELGFQTQLNSPLAQGMSDVVADPIITPPNLPAVSDPFAAPMKIELEAGGTTAIGDIQAPQIGLALKGRQEGSKRQLLGKYGGTAKTEASVQSGLEWLKKQQRKDGSWSLRGPYPDGAERENSVAATAMALLAFQGAGHTHLSGGFRETVAAGWGWLLRQQDSQGCFINIPDSQHRFYAHAQASIALCELLGMTGDQKLLAPAERAITYCIQTQSEEGGWKYLPKLSSDTSVTGWVMMALQSAKMAGLAIPAETLKRVETFLDSTAMYEGSRYSYMPGHQSSLAMTAEGLLCRQYLGWSRTDKRLIEGAKYLTQKENLVDFQDGRDSYYWYYATQFCHHMEGAIWTQWNNRMRQLVPEQQVKKGPTAGSWDPQRPSVDAWGYEGGRLFVTCLSIYMLEVYYRHLPLYGKDVLKAASKE